MICFPASVGPKKRNYRLPHGERPNKATWSAFLAQPGPSGGRAAHAVSFAEYSHQEDTVDEQGGTPLTGYVVWRAKTGKVCRRLFITYGFVKQFLNGHVLQKFGDNYIFHPNYYRTSLFHGVGYQPPATTAFKFWVLQFLQSIRRFDQPPVLWHRSSTTQLDKRNGKTLRLINLLDPLGRGFYNHLWSRCTPKSPRAFAAGYARQKNRLETIF